MAHHPNNDTYPVQFSALKKSNYVVLHNVPCKITDISTKHGEAEVHIVSVDIFTGKKYEDTVPSTQVMQVPNVTHEEYLLASIDDDDVLVLEHGAEGVPKYIKLPPGKLGEQITSNFHMDKTIVVVVLGAMGGEQVVSQKVT